MKEVAHLQLMLERDGKMAEFDQRIQALAKGRAGTNSEPASLLKFAATAASELYHDVWPTQAFQQLKVDEVEMENERSCGCSIWSERNQDMKTSFSLSTRLANTSALVTTDYKSRRPR